MPWSGLLLELIAMLGSLLARVRYRVVLKIFFNPFSFGGKILSFNRVTNAYTYLFPTTNLLRASFEIAWPQTSLMGGFVRPHCWRKIGHAKMAWNLYSFSRSISTLKIENIYIRLLLNLAEK